MYDWILGTDSEKWTWQKRALRVLAWPFLVVIGLPLLIMALVILYPVVGVLQLYSYIRYGK